MTRTRTLTALVAAALAAVTLTACGPQNTPPIPAPTVDGGKVASMKATTVTVFPATDAKVCYHTDSESLIDTNKEVKIIQAGGAKRFEYEGDTKGTLTLTVSCLDVSGKILGQGKAIFAFPLPPSIAINGGSENKKEVTVTIPGPMPTVTYGTPAPQPPQGTAY